MDRLLSEQDVINTIKIWFNEPISRKFKNSKDIEQYVYDSVFEKIKAIPSAELPISVLEDIKAEILLRAENVKSIRTDGHCFFTADEILEIIDKHIGKGANEKPHSSQQDLNEEVAKAFQLGLSFGFIDGLKANKTQESEDKE